MHTCSHVNWSQAQVRPSVRYVPGSYPSPEYALRSRLLEVRVCPQQVRGAGTMTNANDDKHRQVRLGTSTTQTASVSRAAHDTESQHTQHTAGNLEVVPFDARGRGIHQKCEAQSTLLPRMCTHHGFVPLSRRSQIRHGHRGELLKQRGISAHDRTCNDATHTTNASRHRPAHAWKRTRRTFREGCPRPARGQLRSPHWTAASVAGFGTRLFQHQVTLSRPPRQWAHLYDS